MWKNKNILVGISGGIAAYKIPGLIRLLKKNGAHVKVIATENALEFVTPLTLETLSQNKIYTNVFNETNEYSTEHISLTDWADYMIVAPATGNIIGKFANGIADDALSTTFLAFNKPVFVCPSMNVKMYAHFSVQKNIAFLTQNNIHIIEPAFGDLACGYEGKGRMEEPEIILQKIEQFFNKETLLKGKTILVTAGPTHEKIDAVRFIGNYSSGRMGFAIAEELASQGTNVILVAGPCSLQTKSNRIKRINVESADEMYAVSTEYFPSCQAAILSAAVADFKPQHQENDKIKKTSAELTLHLVQTPDILATLGKQKTTNQILVGFALETNNEIENAKTKLKNKNLDFIVLNSLNDSGAGFKHATNKITIIDKHAQVEQFPLKSKDEVAVDIVQKLITLLP